MKKIQIIVNPGAGRSKPILQTINSVLQDTDISWDISITQKPGDGKAFATEAVERGADLVAVYGGDGTVMEAANGLIENQVPLAILPGGTANVMAIELGIPRDLREACTLLAGPVQRLRQVDVGKIEENYFILRVGIGLEATMIAGADQELKYKVGTLAYVLSGLQALRDPQVAHYNLVLDENEVEAEGVTCFIANSGNVGLPHLTFSPHIEVDDGLLDVLIIQQADINTLMEIATGVVSGEENIKGIRHWQAHNISVSSEPAQIVQVDGEILYETPVQIQVLPGAIQIVVPPT